MVNNSVKEPPISKMNFETDNKYIDNDYYKDIEDVEFDDEVEFSESCKTNMPNVY